MVFPKQYFKFSEWHFVVGRLSVFVSLLMQVQRLLSQKLLELLEQVFLSPGRLDL